MTLGRVAAILFSAVKNAHVSRSVKIWIHVSVVRRALQLPKDASVNAKLDSVIVASALRKLLEAKVRVSETLSVEENTLQKVRLNFDESVLTSLENKGCCCCFMYCKKRGGGGGGSGVKIPSSRPTPSGGSGGGILSMGGGGGGGSKIVPDVPSNPGIPTYEAPVAPMISMPKAPVAVMDPTPIYQPPAISNIMDAPAPQTNNGGGGGLLGNIGLPGDDGSEDEAQLVQQAAFFF